MAKLVCGVGLNDLRWGTSEKNHSRREVAIYQMWLAMLHRCYDSKFHVKFPTYIGCTCDPRWLTLSNFAHDVYNLPGYDQWKAAGYRGYAIDKDIRVKGNKHYSLSTCSIITIGQNSADAAHRCSKGKEGKPVELSIDNGPWVYYESCIACSRAHGHDPVWIVHHLDGSKPSTWSYKGHTYSIRYA